MQGLKRGSPQPGWSLQWTLARLRGESQWSLGRAGDIRQERTQEMGGVPNHSTNLVRLRVKLFLVPLIYKEFYIFLLFK